jgi:hypothetical protein
MAEAIFPFIVYPVEGQLPFLNTARVMKGDELLATNVPVSVWPVGNAFSSVGLAYDHQGEAPLDFAQLLRTPNARLFIDDERYTIVNIEKNLHMPHVALTLREMRPAL